MITRALEQRIRDRMFRGKAIILYGARQVGKTSLIESITRQHEGVFWLNCDEADIRELLTHTTSGRLRSLIGNHRIVVVDEAQRVPDIGITLKLITDQIKEVQLIATGSSPFELAGSLKEPLTGRKYEFFLHPVSFSEMVDHTRMLEERRLLEHRLVYGSYPEIITGIGQEEELLKLLADSYLYKDLLMLEGIKKPLLLGKILKALALQLGSEVSYHELGQLVHAKSETVEKYIGLLEQVYIVFQLPAYSANVRNEIRKGKKIYFHDNGIRNAILGNFNLLSSRTDSGALWENYLISERIKLLSNLGISHRSFFWRTTGQQEIDYIEERNGRLHAYEFKWGQSRVRFPLTFTRAYPDCTCTPVNRTNYDEFIRESRVESQ
jgi:uncharacterized protein